MLIAHASTGVTDLAIGESQSDFGQAPRRRAGDLQANDILGGQIIIMILMAHFQLFSGLADVPAGGGASDRYEVYLPYIHDTGTANHIKALYVPVLPDINEHRTVLVKLANAVTGPCDFSPNNFPTKPVTHPDGSPIKAGDGVVNQIWLLCFDGGNGRCSPIMQCLGSRLGRRDRLSRCSL